MLPAFSLFVGVGHPFRRDDGVGPWLADRLADAGCNAVAHAGDGADLVALFSEADDILLADAMQSGRPAGSTTLLDARATRLPHGAFRNSTHEFGLVQAVETARALGLLPRSLRVVGIEGRDFGFGEGLSGPVGAAAARMLPELMSAGRAARMASRDV
jgi:hydrogenase maturation protease